VVVEAVPIRAAHDALDALAHALALIARGAALPVVVAEIALAAAEATGADLAVVRVAADDGVSLAARAVSPAESALAAELEGSRIPVDGAPATMVAEPSELPAATRRTAERTGADAMLFVPAHAGTELVGSVELLRAGEPFSAGDRAFATLAAAQLAVAVHAGRRDPHTHEETPGGVLDLAGAALAAGADEQRAGQEIVRVAAYATRAVAAALWLVDGGALSLGAVAEVAREDERLDGARAIAADAMSRWQPLTADEAAGLPGGAASVVTVQVGAPPVAALQLFYAAGASPNEAALGQLTSFSVRAAQALRSSSRAREMGVELARTRALLAVVGQAIARLSLAHTLETAVERIAELLTIERVAVYLRTDGELLPAAGRGVGGSHALAAQRLLDVVLGAFRARGVVVVPAEVADATLQPARASLDAAGLESAVAVPLRVREDAIGLLVAYPPAGRVLADTEIRLLEALAAQLAVAVQNAQLHEQA
jgi:GAF domain-containing protein